jgi:hypothetical protein
MKNRIFIVIILLIIICFLHQSFSEQKPLQKPKESPVKTPSSQNDTVTKPSQSQVQTQEGTKTEFYDLEVNDIYLDKGNKIWFVLRLLEGTIPKSDYGKIKVSFNIPTLGFVPEVPLSQIDPAGELNNRKRKEINTNLILKREDTVVFNLKNITDKNSQNNSLKKKLIPYARDEENKAPAGIHSPLSSSQQIIKESKMHQEPGTQIESKAKIETMQTKIPSKASDTMKPLSTQLPEVLNILYVYANMTSPQNRELSLENDINSTLNEGGLSIRWESFLVEDFKQITITIVYVDETGRERLVDEFTRGLNQETHYFRFYKDIFDFLKRSHIIARVEPWKTYKFRVRGSVTIEKPSSSQIRQGSGLTTGSGMQVATQQITGPQGVQDSARRVIPTNGIEIYWFVRPQENNAVQLPASQYQQLSAGIRIIPEPANSEGKFKIELGGYDILRRAGMTRYADESCSLEISLSNFYLVIEDSNNLSSKCSINILQNYWDRLNRYGGNTNYKLIISQFQHYPSNFIRDGVTANFSLLSAIPYTPCDEKFRDPSGKTFRIWAYGDASISVDMPGKKCAICTETHCKYSGGDDFSTNYFVYSEPKYITLYRTEDIPPAVHTPPQQDLPGFKPQKLQLIHPITTINITRIQGQESEVIEQVQGARIGVGYPLNVSWRESLPAETVIYFFIEQFINNNWQQIKNIEHLTSAGENAKELGVFSIGTYRLCHSYKYPDNRRSDWVYFQSVDSASSRQRINLRLSELRTTPRRNNRSLSFRLRNISTDDLTTEYVQSVQVKINYVTTGEGRRDSGEIGAIYDKFYQVPTPIRGIGTVGEPSPSASGITVELPEDYDLPRSARTAVTVRIVDSELWTGDEIREIFITD